MRMKRVSCFGSNQNNVQTCSMCTMCTHTPPTECLLFEDSSRMRILPDTCQYIIGHFNLRFSMLIVTNPFHADINVLIDSKQFSGEETVHQESIPVEAQLFCSGQAETCVSHSLHLFFSCLCCSCISNMLFRHKLRTPLSPLTKIHRFNFNHTHGTRSIFSKHLCWETSRNESGSPHVTQQSCNQPKQGWDHLSKN